MEHLSAQTMLVIIGILQIISSLLWVGVGHVMNEARYTSWKVRVIILFLVVGGVWSGLAHIIQGQTLYVGTMVFATGLVLLPLWVIWFHQRELPARRANRKKETMNHARIRQRPL